MNKYKRRVYGLALAVSLVIIAGAMVPLIRSGSTGWLGPSISLLVWIWGPLWAYSQTHTFADPKRLRELVALATLTPRGAMVRSGDYMITPARLNRRELAIVRSSYRAAIEAAMDLRGQKVSTVPVEVFVISYRCAISRGHSALLVRRDEDGRVQTELLPASPVSKPFRWLRFVGKTGALSVTEGEIAELAEQLRNAVVMGEG